MLQPSTTLSHASLASLALVTALAGGCSDDSPGRSALPTGVSADPARLDYGFVQVGGEATRKVSLTGTGEPASAFSALPTPGLGFTATLDEDQPAGDSIRWIVDYRPTEERTISATLRIFSNDHDATVLLTAFGVRAGWVLAPTEVDFGQVVVGSDAQRAVTITNDGDRAFVPFIRGTRCSPDETAAFCYELGEDEVEPGENTTLTVRFVPTATRTQSRSFFVGDVELPMSGEGVDS